MKFTVNTADIEELNVIQDWSDAIKCREIRNIYYFTDEKAPNYAIKDAKVLEKMFEKYDSNLDKKEIIYRGIRFKKSDKEQMIFFNLLKESFELVLNTSDTISIDMAPASFTRVKKIAEDEFGLVNNKNFCTIIYKLVFRISNEIEIEKGMNDFSYQKEVIIRSQKAEYKVLSIVPKEYDTMIVEITEEET